MSEMKPLSYKRTLDPANQEPAVAEQRAPGVAVDRRDGQGYVYTEEIVLSVNVAIATGRPLLVFGPPGSGKSSLAASVANLLQWSYYEQVITSRTQARDLQWGFDTLRRLNDAELGRLRLVTDEQTNAQQYDPVELAPYIEPGIIWWAFDPASAERRGMREGERPPILAKPPGQKRGELRAVVLLDEIDKADPDVPNDLLVPIGSLQFKVDEIGTVVRCEDRTRPPLLIITSNNERSLPNAFLRRCLTLRLQAPGRDRLLAIARKRFGEKVDHMELQELDDLYGKIAAAMDARPKDIPARQDPPSTAEYLDAITACLALGVKPGAQDPVWDGIQRATLWKPRDALAKPAASL
jgi:MoxR-like ATPase